MAADEPEEAVEADEGPDAFRWPVPWHAYVPGSLLCAIMAVLWLTHFVSGGMADWGVSATALAAGRWETIGLHMFAHGPPFHITLNAMALYSLSGPLVARLGGWPQSWLRLLLLFVLCGLAGMAFFLAFHPRGSVPMIGASGAIYGLFGLLLRLQPASEALVPIRSPRMRRAAIDFVKDNLILVLILTLPALLTGQSGGVAWEAHLGGILFGLFVAPRLLPPKMTPRPA